MERSSFYLVHLNLLRPALLVYLYVCMCKPVYGQINVDNGSGLDVTADVGDNVTLVCDSSNIDEDIYWYTDNLNTDITRNDNIIDGRLPDGDEHRYSIVGDQSNGEKFNLNIQNVQISDSRTYKCVYYSGFLGRTRNILEATTFTVLSLPSDESPICTVYPATGVNLDFQPEDSIRLQCYTTGGSPIPELFWYRNENELLADGSGNIETELTLTSDDNNIVYTCSMKTPALDAPLNCSVTPLQIQTTSIASTTSLSLSPKHSIPSSLSYSPSAYKQSSTTYQHTKMTEAPGEEPISMSNIIIIAAAAGAGFILIMIILIIVCCCLKRKRGKDVNESTNRPFNGEYEMVTSPETDEENTKIATDNLYAETISPQRPNHQVEPGQSLNLDFPVYAQPQKPGSVASNKPNGSQGNYENVDEEKQLVYADLDLPEIGDDVDVIQTDEPTLYAKVKM